MGERYQAWPPLPAGAPPQDLAPGETYPPPGERQRQMAVDDRCGMFQALTRRIVGYVLLSAALFTVVLSTVSFLLVSRSALRTFRASAEATVTQRVERSAMAIAAAQASAVQISHNTAVLEALASDQASPAVKPLLDTLKNTSFGIIGLTLYTPTRTYTTSGMAGVPTLAEMLQEPQIAAFVRSDEPSWLSVRTSHMAQIYQDVRYDPSFGMITYIVRLPQGFLFMDLHPRYIYQSFFDYREHPNFAGIETYILTPRGTYLRSPFNQEEHARYLSEAVPGATTLSRDRRFLIVARPFAAPGSQVVSLVPLEPYYRRMRAFLLLLVGCAGLSALAAWLLGRYLSSTIVGPLMRLRAKMQRWSA